MNGPETITLRHSRETAAHLAHLRQTHQLGPSHALTDGTYRLYGMWATMGSDGYALLPQPPQPADTLPVTPPPHRPDRPPTGHYAQRTLEIAVPADVALLLDLLAGETGAPTSTVARHALRVCRCLLDAAAAGRYATVGRTSR
jgi:hypothetical protein